MEEVFRVALQLDDLVASIGIAAFLDGILILFQVNWVVLIIFLLEGLFTDLATLAVVIAQDELDEAYNNRVLDLTISKSLNNLLDDVFKGELVPHAGRCFNDWVPEGPQHEQEDADLYEQDQHNPVDE